MLFYLLYSIGKGVRCWAYISNYLKHNYKLNVGKQKRNVGIEYPK